MLNTLDSFETMVNVPEIERNLSQIIDYFCKSSSSFMILRQPYPMKGMLLRLTNLNPGRIVLVTGDPWTKRECADFMPDTAIYHFDQMRHVLDDLPPTKDQIVFYTQDLWDDQVTTAITKYRKLPFKQIVL